ncbi:MAG TPA: hypothetical protein VK722_01200 [Candidatus Aquilonibacter sp.]|nr:hypothetical protein [Candidatus Aquilonibacter sp.]
MLDQLAQFIPRHGVEPVQQCPFVASDVGRGANVLAFDQLSKNFWGALKAKMRVIESQHDKDFAADFEAEFIVPLQVLGGLGEFKAKFADCVGGFIFVA